MCPSGKAGLDCDTSSTAATLNTPVAGTLGERVSGNRPIKVYQYTNAGSVGDVEFTLRVTGGYCYYLRAYGNYRCTATAATGSCTEPKPSDSSSSSSFATSGTYCSGCSDSGFSTYDSTLAFDFPAPSSRTSCSCSGSASASEVFEVMVWNDAESPRGNCDFEIVFWDGAAAPSGCWGSSHGTISGTSCTCASGWTGDDCSIPLTALTSGNMVTGTLVPRLYQYYTLDIAANALGEVELQVDTANCESGSRQLSAAVTYGCNACASTPLNTASSSSGFPGTSSNPSAGNPIDRWTTSTGTVSKTFNYPEGTTRTVCTCDGATAERWWLGIVSTCTSATSSTCYPASAIVCSFNVTATAKPPCNGHGTKSGSTCTCNAGWAGDTCDKAVTTLANGTASAPVSVGDNQYKWFKFTQPSINGGVGRVSLNFTDVSTAGGSCYVSSNDRTYVATRYTCPGCNEGDLPRTNTDSDGFQSTSASPPGTPYSIDNLGSSSTRSMVIDWAEGTARTKCGCSGAQDETWWVGVYHYCSSPPCPAPCQFTIEATTTLPCSGKGTRDPTTGVCTCNANAAGTYCEHPVVDATWNGGAVTLDLAKASEPGSTAYVRIASATAATRALNLKMELTGGCFDDIRMLTRYHCGANSVQGGDGGTCGRGLPAETANYCSKSNKCDSSCEAVGWFCTTRNTESSTANQAVPVAVEFPTSDARTECGCSSAGLGGGSTAEVWVAQIIHTDTSDTCTLSFAATTTPACTNHGTLNADRSCTCNSGWGGDDCQFAIVSVSTDGTPTAALRIGDSGSGVQDKRMFTVTNPYGGHATVQFAVTAKNGGTAGECHSQKYQLVARVQCGNGGTCGNPALPVTGGWCSSYCSSSCSGWSCDARDELTTGSSDSSPAAQAQLVFGPVQAPRAAGGCGCSANVASAETWNIEVSKSGGSATACDMTFKATVTPPRGLYAANFTFDSMAVGRGTFEGTATSQGGPDALPMQGITLLFVEMPHQYSGASGAKAEYAVTQTDLAAGGTPVLELFIADTDSHRANMYGEEELGDKAGFGAWSKGVTTTTKQLASNVAQYSGFGATNRIWDRDFKGGERVVVGIRNTDATLTSHTFKLEVTLTPNCPYMTQSPCSNVQAKYRYLDDILSSAPKYCQQCAGNGTCGFNGACQCIDTHSGPSCYALRKPFEMYNKDGVVEDESGSKDTTRSDFCVSSSCGFDSDRGLMDRRILLSGSNDLFQFDLTWTNPPESGGVVSVPSHVEGPSLYVRYGQLPMPHKGLYNYSVQLSGSSLSTSFKLEGDAIVDGYWYLTILPGNVTFPAPRVQYTVTIEDSLGTAFDIVFIIFFVIVFPCSIFCICKKLGGPAGIKKRWEAVQAKASETMKDKAATDDTKGIEEDKKKEEEEEEEEEEEGDEEKEEGEGGGEEPGDPSSEDGTYKVKVNKDGIKVKKPSAIDESEVEVEEGKAMAKKYAATAAAEGAAAVASNFDYIVTLVLKSVELVFLMIKTLFNLSIIWASLESLSAVARWPDIELSLKNVFGPISGFSITFTNVFDTLNFLPRFAETWNCGGALQFLTVIVLFATITVAFIVLRKDLLLFAAIKIKVLRRGTTGTKRKVVDSLSKTSVVLLLYALQSLLTSSGRLSVAVIQGRGSCSSVDYALRTLALVVLYQSFFYIACGFVYNFAGRVNWSGGIYGFVLQAFVNIVAVTFGIWTRMQEYAYEIVRRAETFDDDPDDDDNQHENVISVVGRSRATIWMALPGCAMLAKMAETLNAPPAIVTAKGIELATPFKKRAFKYGNALVTWGITLLVVYTGDEGIVVTLLLSLLPSWGLGVYDEMMRVKEQVDAAATKGVTVSVNPGVKTKTMAASLSFAKGSATS